MKPVDTEISENRILRLPEVMHLTGLSRSSIYARIGQGTFPKQTRIGVRAVGWRQSHILRWIDERTEGTGNDR